MDKKLWENIPEGEVELPKPYVIKGVKSALIFGDVHIPFHDKKALELTLNSRDNYDVIIINGDLLDFPSMSSKFLHKPTKLLIKSDIEIAKQFLQYLRGKFPKAQIVFQAGNHDIRFDDYIMRNAPALYELDLVNLKSILELKKHGIDYVENGQFIKIGSLWVIHGNEVKVNTIVNTSRTVFLKTFDNVAFNHTHKTQTHIQTNIDKTKSWGTHNIGCGCNLFPRYMPANGWNLGFGECDFDKQYYRLHNRMIINYEII